jgi:hypothetical protein
VGLYAPLSELGEVREEGLGTAIELGRKRSTLAFGLAGEVGSGSLGFRANLAYATSSDVPIGGVGCETCSARSTLLVATAGASLRPIPRLIGLQPYLLVGGGIKRYGFDREQFEEEGFGGVLDDHAKAALQLGVGADFALGGLGLFSELNAYLSGVDPAAEGSGFESDSRFQTDLLLSVGLRLGG